MEEIKKAGGDAIAVGGDVTAQDFPKKIVSAAIECAEPFIVFCRLPSLT